MAYPRAVRAASGALRNIRMRYLANTSMPNRENRNMPWNTPVTALGRFISICAVLAADVGERHDEAGQHDADGVQSPQEGDDDRGEAVADGKRRHQLADRPGRLEQARQPGQAAGNHQAGPNHPLFDETAEPGGPGRLAHDLDLVAEDMAPQHHPGDGGDGERHQETDVGAGFLDQ